MSVYSFGSGSGNNGGSFLSFGTATVGDNNKFSNPAKEIGVRVADSGSSHLPYSGDGGVGNYFGEIMTHGQTALVSNQVTNPLAKNGVVEPDRTPVTQIGRHFPITSIDYESGQVTWGANVGESYVMVADTGTTYVDRVYDATNSPYAVPARLTYLSGLTPQTKTYRTA